MSQLLSRMMGSMNNGKKPIVTQSPKAVGAKLNNSTPTTSTAAAAEEGAWKGFDPYSHLFRDLEFSNHNRSQGEGLGERGDQSTDVLSWEPRAFLYHNFLSKEECEHLIKLATPHMTRSLVGSTTGGGQVSSSRTSTGRSLGRGRDKIIQDIEKRIADFTFIPVENSEGLQVIHYEAGQKFDLHYDTFTQEVYLKRGGQRIATILIYLSDVEEGGETVFPSAKGGKCNEKGLSVKPKMGDALLFWSIKPDGTLDPHSRHGGSPVIKGNKWACTTWLHPKEYK